MSEEGSGATNLGFFLAGLGMGAVVALLLAPRSGKETRDYIAGRTTCVTKQKALSIKARIL